MATSSSITSSNVLSLYRNLLRQSSKFQSFNYRKYAHRRVREHFKENKVLTDPQRIRQEYDRGFKSLAMLERQSSISQMYSAPKLVVEKI